MSLNPDDTTKPSRVNRKRKRRWRPNLISYLIKSGLTDCYRLPHNLPAVSTLTVGIRAPGKGHNRPHLHAAFLYPSGTQLLFKEYFVYFMVGCIEQPLKRLAGSFAGSSNLIHSTAQQLELVGGGLSLIQRKPL